MTSGPRTLGRYDLLGHLATGGMAEVFLARVQSPHDIEKLVVLKRVLSSLAKNEDYVRMFLDEARIAATLQHPNVVQVYDVGEAGGDYYIAMEYLRGSNLRRLQRRAAQDGIDVPIDLAVSIVSTMCSGLHYAHEQRSLDGLHLGIVHRDVSPQNVFVTYEGHIKLMDFGIAKAVNRITETAAGVVKGKPGYMAPEQCLGRTVDRRADIFAASIILWELLTGRGLYCEHGEYKTMKRVVEEDAPSPRLHRTDCPPELEEIVRRGLQRDPNDRYQSAQELQVDLEALAREHKLRISPVELSTFMDELFPNGREDLLGGADADPPSAVGPTSPNAEPLLSSSHGTAPTMLEAALATPTPALERAHPTLRVRRPMRATRGLVRALPYVVAALIAGAALRWMLTGDENAAQDAETRARRRALDARREAVAAPHLEAGALGNQPTTPGRQDIDPAAVIELPGPSSSERSTGEADGAADAEEDSGASGAGRRAHSPAADRRPARKRTRTKQSRLGKGRTGKSGKLLEPASGKASKARGKRVEEPRAAAKGDDERDARSKTGLEPLPGARDDDSAAPAPSHADSSQEAPPQNERWDPDSPFLP